MDRTIYIGLTGRMASGKGEVVKILQRSSYKYISLSDIVREEASRINPDPTRGEMQDIGNSLRQNEGAGVLGKRVREKLENSAIKKWIIDGIRNPAEVRELKKLGSFYLLGIDSDTQTILNRIKRRKRTTDIADDQELLKRLNREWGQGEPPEGQQVGACIEMADLVIENNSSITELRENIYQVIKTIERKNG